MTDVQQVHPDCNTDRPVENPTPLANGINNPPANADGLEQREADDLEGECDCCPPPLSRRKAGYWMTLVFFVGPFYIIPPLSWAYTVYATVRLSEAWMKGASPSKALPIWQWLLLLYTGMECIFSVYYYFLCRKVSKRKSQLPKRDPAELREGIQRFLETDVECRPAQPPNAPTTSTESPVTIELRSELFRSLPSLPLQLSYDDPRAIDFRNHFRLWFRGRPWRKITRASMREWFAWSLFDLHQKELDDTQKDMVEDAVVLIERRAGCSLSNKGKGKETRDVLRLTTDPIVTWSRPGLLYAVAGAMNIASGWWLKWRYGMVKQEFQGIEYLIREGSSTSASEPSLDPEPIFLLHGLGFGLLQYLRTIVYILKRIPPEQPLVVPLDPSVSQSIWHPSHLEPMSRRNWVQGLKGLIEKHGWDGDVTMISHSKGSYVHTWMLKEHPELVKRSCFADPVCFCIWEGDLCWNFIYRAPRTTWQLIIKYFAATEPGISLAVQRHFDWVANALWVEEIPRSTEPYYSSFLLGALDVVINTARVKRYLEKHGIREGIHWDPRGHHAEAAIGGTGLQNIVNWLQMPKPSAVSPVP
ncbi:hypothetical protein FRC04_010769 [Tulasnella sp. 424]|nr:hypothetical protein FRC04_010769 [Tulasnella sp. 424]KAG8969294.1 hypothetical protein FRC05_001154 [Tulasnella sp. 425]